MGFPIGQNHFRFSRAIILAAHADDGEFGCGGTIARLLEDGTEVHYVAFSICEESIPDGFPRDVLATEIMNATASLGMSASNVYVHRFPVRRLSEHRQDILEELVRLRRLLGPTLVLLPSRFDIHQDHVVIHREGIRAFKQTTIIGYELPMNNLESSFPLYVGLTEGHLQKKKEALAEYKSQVHREQRYEDSLVLAKLRGHQIGIDFAEAFDILRWVVK